MCCGSKTEVTAAEEEELHIGADVFDGSDVNPVGLRNAHVAWMTFINKCRRMTLEIVQRSEVSNNAGRNPGSHYRGKGTREILRLSHEVDGKTMEPGEDPFKVMIKNDRLAGDLHRLGDRPVTELEKCMIIVAGLSGDYAIACRMLENNSTGLERTEIERAVRNQYSRFLRQQQDSKTLSASKGTTTADRGEENRRPRNRFEVNCFDCGKKGHRAEECRSAKRIEKSKDRKIRRCCRRQEMRR